MNTIELGRTVGLLTNIGVLAGIVWLAYELEQNNSLLEAQASHELLQDRLDIRSGVVNGSDEVTEFWVRVSTNAPLTIADELRLTSFVEGVLLRWQYEYSQYADGKLTEAGPPVDAFRATFRGEGFAGIRIFPEVWQSFQAQLRPEFVEWMQTNVVNPP
jgi:hypothetical protein